MEILDQILALAKTGGQLVSISFRHLLAEPLRIGSRVFWVYLLSSLAAALLVYLFVPRERELAGQSGRMGVKGFLRFCFPRSVWEQPSAWFDVRYYFVHLTFQGVILPFFHITYVTAIALGVESWVMGRYGTAPLWEYRDSEFAAFVCTLGGFLVIDLVNYATHVLQHKVPLLWEFHKVHHSATVLHPLTNFREHPVDNIVYGWTTGLGNGIVIGLLLCLFDEHRTLMIFGAAPFALAYNFFAYHLRHSHIWLAWPPALGRILGSPANHQIHHSAEARHLNKNFGFTLALWDWMFGTLYLPRERETFQVGLGDGTEPQYSSFLRLYFLPFIRIFQTTARRFSRAAA